MNTVSRKVRGYVSRVKSRSYDLRNALIKFNRNIRNIFTNEQEKELTELAQKYLRLHDTIEDYVAKAKKNVYELENPE